MATYMTDQSELFRQAVSSLEKLLQNEGFDSVLRAYATVSSEPIKLAQIKGKKPHKSSHVCIHRLLGRKRCPDTLDKPCNSPQCIPGIDHSSEWTRDSKTVAIYSQPYHLSYDTIKETVEFCKVNDLEVCITAESWHFPSRTLLVEYNRKST